MGVNYFTSFPLSDTAHVNVVESFTKLLREGVRI